MFSSDMLMDNIWAHLEEAPVEKSRCFHSCSFYSKINSSFIVTYMYWNSFTFHTHLDGFTCATPRGFFYELFLMCGISFQVTWVFWSLQCQGLYEYLWTGRDTAFDTVEPSKLSTQTPRNPIGEGHSLRYPCSFPGRS